MGFHHHHKMLYDVEDYDLYVSPKSARFSPLKGGASRHLMVNGSSERIGIKIKCSNNNVYRISPVYTVLEPGRAQRLQVVRDPGEPGVDKLVVMYLNTGLRNVRDAFLLARREAEEVERENRNRFSWRRRAVVRNPIRKALIKLDARPMEGEEEPAPPEHEPPPVPSEAVPLEDAGDGEEDDEVLSRDVVFSMVQQKKKQQNALANGNLVPSNVMPSGLKAPQKRASFEEPTTSSAIVGSTTFPRLPLFPPPLLGNNAMNEGNHRPRQQKSQLQKEFRKRGSSATGGATSIGTTGTNSSFLLQPQQQRKVTVKRNESKISWSRNATAKVPLPVSKNNFGFGSGAKNKVLRRTTMPSTLINNNPVPKSPIKFMDDDGLP